MKEIVTLIVFFAAFIFGIWVGINYGVAATVAYYTIYIFLLYTYVENSAKEDQDE